MSESLFENPSHSRSSRDNEAPLSRFSRPASGKSQSLFTSAATFQTGSEMKKHNKRLAGTAKQAGVIKPVEYAIFMDQANRIHEEVGRKVRRTIHELGGTMPENLPVAENIKKVESRAEKSAAQPAGGQGRMKMPKQDKELAGVRAQMAGYVRDVSAVLPCKKGVNP